MLLAEVHAQCLLGDSAFKLATQMRDYFLAPATVNSIPNWELALTHAIYAHAALVAKRQDEYLISHAAATQAIAAIELPEDRQLVLQTFDQIPVPAATTKPLSFDPGPPDYLAGNIAAWQINATHYVTAAEKAWLATEPYWGVYSIPDSQTHLLPKDMSGLHCIELGCGTGYVSAWMRRRGATVVALDPTPNQLATARRLQAQHQLEIEFIEGFAESVPFADASFDFAISEYGAALWSDPYRWIPEAARLLKPGGQLVLLTNSALMTLCAPEFEADGAIREQLLRPYFGMHAIQWPDSPGQTEFHLNHSDWISLFSTHRLTVERLIELQVPDGATTRYTWANSDWGSQWPLEEAWVVRKAI